MRSSQEFGLTVRSGVRAGRPTLVLHARRLPERSGTQLGFVVSKAVGNAVVRNRVKRRLRHLARALLLQHPGGYAVVIRALPAAAGETADLSGDLVSAWRSVVRKLSAQRPTAVAEGRPA